MDTKIIVACILSILIAVGVTFGAQHYMTLRAKAQLADSRGSVITATSGITQAADKTDTQRTTNDNGIAAVRAVYSAGQDHDEASVDRQSRAVPDSLRSLARERRLARERLGRTRIGSQAQPASTGVAER